VIVADDIYSDIQGAQDAGLKATLVNRCYTRYYYRLYREFKALRKTDSLKKFH